MISYKKVLRKNPLLVENASEERMFTTMEKGTMIMKTTLAIFNMQMNTGKVLL